ncbi:oligosaccharide flippase family protein [Candidatus Kuenenia sp.]|uniref:oligosaccharide flippase family protein n=1 Tax=Candidatus Kuenenia sp. TaxID=2499824 RepID=UPI003220934B
MINNKLIKSGFYLFVASLVGNVSAYFFQFYMSRKLSVEDFGMFNSLLSLSAIISVPAGTVLVVMARYVSKFNATCAVGKIKYLLYNAYIKLLLAGILGVGIFVSLSGYISDYLNIGTRFPLILIGVSLLISLLLPINMGILQGLQKFGYMGLSGILSGVLRLACGVLLISLGLGVNGAIVAGIIPSLVMLFITFYPIRFLFNKAVHNDNERYTKEILLYSLPVTLSTLCFTGLINIDLVLVKHFFSPEEAGNYAAAAILGRSIFYLPGAIILAMFPMVSESHTLNKDTYGLLSKALIFTLLLSGVGLVLFSIFPSQLMGLLMGKKFIPIAPLLRIFGFAMLPFALLNIVINFNLARHSTKFVYTLVPGCLLEVFLLYIFHNSLTHVIYIMGGSGALLFFVNFFLILREKIGYVYRYPQIAQIHAD